MANPTQRKGLGFWAAFVTAQLLVVFALLEIALRAAPQFIPLPILISFNRELRKDIAKRVQLQTTDDKLEIKRDDDGPSFGIYKPHTKVVYKFEDYGVVNEVTMDKNGFCNPPEVAEKATTAEILAIGDSLTWCTTVHPNETWTYNIGKATGKTAYNMGLPGAGPYEYLQILKWHGLMRSPEVVIMAIYGGNDLRGAENMKLYKEYVPPPCAVYCRAYRHLKEQSFIGRHSYAFNVVANGARYLKNTIRDRDGPQAPAEVPGAPPASAINFKYKVGAVVFNSQNLDNDEVEFAQRVLSGNLSLEVFTRSLIDYGKLAKEHQFVPVLTYIPSAYSAYEKFVKFEDRKMHELMLKFDATQRAYFKKKALELGLKFFDPTEYLRSVAGAHLTNETLMYYPTNLHLTREGHKRISEFLLQKLKSL